MAKKKKKKPKKTPRLPRRSTGKENEVYLIETKALGDWYPIVGEAPCGAGSLRLARLRLKWKRDEWPEGTYRLRKWVRQ